MGEYISKYATGAAVDNALDAGLAASAEVATARGGFESLSLAIAAKASEAEAEEIRARLDALEYEDITITSFTASPTLCEMGSSQTISLAWSLSKAATSQSIDGVSVSGNNKQIANVTSGKTYTLSVSDGKSSSTKSTSVVFANRVYFGAATDLTTVTQLNSALSSSAARTITVDAGTGKYVVYAIPSRLGNVSFFVSGFEGGFEAPVEQTITNASGYSETYKVYRSTNAGLGETTVEIKEV